MGKNYKIESMVKLRAFAITKAFLMKEDAHKLLQNTNNIEVYIEKQK